MDVRPPIRYGSVCSGIEAATAAWHPLGWAPEWFCEIEAFPSAVLAHHHPEVPNHGDFTQLLDPAHPARHGAPIDLLVGGTPCQSFSHAGGRAGLDDPRGQLMLRYLDLVGVLRPRWIVWENVPGVLSSGGGRDFGALLGGLADLGYGVAYRVLDARFFGVPQRRRRVFVVGHSGGDAERAARVLALDEGVRGHLAARGNSRKEAAAAVGGGAAVSGGHWVIDGNSTPKVAKDQSFPLRADYGSGGRQFVTSAAADRSGEGRGAAVGGERADVWTLEVRGREGGCNLEYRADGTANALRASNGGRAGMGVGAVAVTPFDTTQITSPKNYSHPKAGDPCHPLSATAHPPAIVWCPDVSGPLGGEQVTSFTAAMGGNDGGVYTDGTVATLRSGMGCGGNGLAVAVTPLRVEGQPAVAFGIRSDSTREGAAKTPSKDALGNVRLRNAGFNVYEETAPTLDSAPHFVAAWGISSDALDRSGESAEGGAAKRSGMGIVSCLTPWDTQQRRVFDAAAGVFPSLDVCANTTGGHRGPPSLLIADQRGHDGAPSQAAPPLSADADKGDQDTLVLQPVSFKACGGPHRNAAVSAYSPSLDTQTGNKMVNVQQGSVVRRLTPRECERLQGFPDDHTLIPWKGKPATDGHRYKALGNSMAVPVMRWIGERIEQEDARSDQPKSSS